MQKRLKLEADDKENRSKEVTFQVPTKPKRGILKLGSEDKENPGRKEVVPQTPVKQGSDSQRQYSPYEAILVSNWLSSSFVCSQGCQEPGTFVYGCQHCMVQALLCYQCKQNCQDNCPCCQRPIIGMRFHRIVSNL